MNPHNNTNSSTVSITWLLWEATFEPSQVDLLSDYVDPVEERHMELRPDDAASIEGKRLKRALSDQSSSSSLDSSFSQDHNSSLWPIVFDINDDILSSPRSTMKLVQKVDPLRDGDHAFLKSLSEDHILSRKRLRLQCPTPPGF